MIYPEIFDGFVMGFFTGKDIGLKVEALTGRRVYYPTQQHTDKVILLKDKIKPHIGDAVITRRNDILLGIKSADCVPILIYDKLAHAIGAVHAGWRGTAAGILKKTIAEMKEAFCSDPEDLLISMGPAIRWCCYEVGKDVIDAVEKQTGPGEYFRSKKSGKFCLDLQSANKAQALSMGVLPQNISIIEECTFCFPERYNSYRYALKHGGSDTEAAKKRQGGFIGMP